MSLPPFEYFKSHFARQLFIRLQPFCHLAIWRGSGGGGLGLAGWRRSHIVTGLMARHLIHKTTSFERLRFAAPGDGGWLAFMNME